jgi:homoserine kinase
VPLPFGGSSNNQQPLWFVLVNPKFEAPTKEMRAVLPKEVRYFWFKHTLIYSRAYVFGLQHEL